MVGIKILLSVATFEWNRFGQKIRRDSSDLSLEYCISQRHIEIQ